MEKGICLICPSPESHTRHCPPLFQLPCHVTWAACCSATSPSPSIIIAALMGTITALQPFSFSSWHNAHLCTLMRTRILFYTWPCETPWYLVAIVLIASHYNKWLKQTILCVSSHREKKAAAEILFGDYWNKGAWESFYFLKVKTMLVVNSIEEFKALNVSL